MKKVAGMLRKLEKNRLPRLRTTLATFAAGIFQNKLPKAEVERIVKQLFVMGLVAEPVAGKALTYNL